LVSPVSILPSTILKGRAIYAAGLSSLMALFLVGCQSPRSAPTGDFSQVGASRSESVSPRTGQGPTNAQPAGASQVTSLRPESLTLREGDTVRVTFPGAANLNTAQQIRRDGKISLPLVGEVKAAGMTPVDLEKDLVKLYGPQLVTKEVNVTLESSAYFVFVTGAVLRPGRIVFDRPITVLEAVIDAGVDYSKANLKDVTVIRRQTGRDEHYFHLNLKRELQGQPGEPFYLQPSDIVFVREKFTWF
jgi:polysaccharide biosynthesis/export protein